MCNPRAHLEQDGRIELFRNLIRQAREFQRLLRVGRLEHRNLGGNRMMTGILFILGRMHPRVICDHDHQSGIDPGIRHRIERIGGDIQSDMLHRAK